MGCPEIQDVRCLTLRERRQERKEKEAFVQQRIAEHPMCWGQSRQGKSLTQTTRKQEDFS